MVIYQNLIACAWVIHWKRKEDITQPGLDGTRLGANSMADRLPPCWTELLSLDVHQIRSIVWVISLLQMSLSPLVSRSL